MLVRDLRTGRLIAVPDNHIFASPSGGYQFGSYAPGSAHGLGGMPGFGHYGAAPGQVIYDGLGNPLGLPFLAALAPLAGKALALLPMIAGKAGALLPALAGKVGAALPSVSNLLPQITSAATPVLPMTSRGVMAQGIPQMPQGMPAPEMMASQSMQPMHPPIQPWVQPSMPAQMPSPTQPSMPPIWPPSAEPPAGLPAMAAREEVVVAPMRVQQPNGETVVVPVRLRRRRRSRRRIQPVSFAPGPAEPPRNLQGWFGFNGWRGY